MRMWGTVVPPGREPNRRARGTTRNAHVRDNNRSVTLLNAH
jgi:hypothetical protein